jgi:hypothetical protein
MERAAGRGDAGRRRRGAGGLPARPAAGAARARAHLEYQGAHRAPGPEGPGWQNDPAILRRVRDALASGGWR